jgi:hypothetical protein
MDEYKRNLKSKVEKANKDLASFEYKFRV